MIMYSSSKVISVGEARRKVKEFLEEENEEGLFAFADEVLSQEEVYGSADDFHNFSLDFYRIDDYSTACRVLKKGLEQFPNSVDLLADYLQFGINCNQKSECEYYYQRLLAIPKTRWTWRGFSFSLDYMLYLADGYSEVMLESYKKELLDMANEYHSFFPYSEDPFFCKADIYSYYNDFVNVKRILQEATVTVGVCPKCSMRLADILIENGEFPAAMDVIDKALYETVETQDSVNYSYMYYLSGLCKIIDISKTKDFQNNDKVISIFHDFAIAQKCGLSHSSYLKVIKRQINVLETKSGLKYEDYSD